MKKARKRLREPQTLGDSPLSWIVDPISVNEFKVEYFEVQPLHISNRPGHYVSRDVWSSAAMLRAASESILRVPHDVTVTNFDATQQKRINAPLNGAVTAAQLREYMAKGWSVRFLRPHEHSATLWNFIVALGNEFSAAGGSNSYWTPKNGQGFAPHYDDVDVFLLQLEGSKAWRVYAPPTEEDVLARFSSADYAQDELPPPWKTLTLREGDLLYMPRGWVHQGIACEEDSLHVTVSVNHLHTWADLVKTILMQRIEDIAAKDVNWRKAVPAEWWSSMGFAPSMRQPTPPHRTPMMESLKACIDTVVGSLTEKNLDEGVDHFATEMMERMPPNTSVIPKIDLSLKSRVRLSSSHELRLDMSVDGEARVYHRPVGEARLLRFEADFAPGILALMDAFPHSIALSDIPMPAFEQEDADENRIILCQSLAEVGAIRLSE